MTKTSKLNARQKVFEKYWNEKDIEAGLENGFLFEGVIRINPKNYKEAYITAPNSNDADILIDGVFNRNRALNGDVVVCTFLSAEIGKHEEIDSSCDMRLGKRDIQDERKNISEKEQESSVDHKKKPFSQTLHEGKRSVFNSSEDRKVCLSTGVGTKLTNKVRITEGKSPCFEKVKQESGLDTEKNEEFDVSEMKKKKNRRSKRRVKETFLDFTKCSLDEAASGDSKQKASQKLTVDEIQMDNESQVAIDGNQILEVPCTRTVEEVEEMPQTEANHRKKAKVVFIKEYKHSRRAIGHLKNWPNGPKDEAEPKWILFSPKDHRIPRIKIPHTSELSNFMSHPSMLYLAQIVAWDDVQHPLGALCYCVGESGDLEAETLALLLENGIDYSPFTSEVLTTLPQLPWSIPKEEMEKRKDFRNSCIFTIDPADARDLDDAVCGRFLRMSEDGTCKLFEISVHIADVSFFVKEDTILDKVAANRATSTYLVDRVIPMLPSVLCEHVCSLNPGEDRLAFSVEWIIDENGEIIREWFGRSVIRSCVKLSYDHAQAVIEGRSDVSWPPVEDPHSLNDVQSSIEVLQSVAIILREKRRRQGALRIDLPRLSFNMDWSTRTPTGFRLYEIKDSNRLIEEFMLLANMRVAEKIYEAFPNIAVLRSHPPPNSIKLAQVADSLQAVGIHLDISSSAALQQSLAHYGQGDGDPVSLGRNLVISHLLAKPMKCAMYICSGAVKSELNYRHFALSIPFYTHFTSPIRRYPDILVHRLLSAALDGYSMDHWNQGTLRKQLETCNSRKLSAKALQELHNELHLSALVRKTGSIEVKGIVLAVLDHAVDVVLLYLGVVRRLYLEKLPLDELRFQQDNGIGTLNLTWTASNGVPAICQSITLFSVLEIIMVPHEKGELQFSLVLQHPSAYGKFATDSKVE